MNGITYCDECMGFCSNSFEDCHGDVQSRISSTVCIKEDDDGQLYVSYSKVHPNDIGCKRIGREKSLSNLTKTPSTKEEIDSLIDSLKVRAEKEELDIFHFGDKKVSFPVKSHW